MSELKYRELVGEEKEIANVKAKRIVDQTLKALVRFIDTGDRMAFRAAGDQIDAFKDEYCEEEGVN